MQSVGPSPDSDQLVQNGPVPAKREPIPDTPLAAIQRFAGNRAVAALFGGGPQRVAGGADVPAPAPPVVTGRTDVPVPPLEDPDFNPTTRAHDLVRAIDSSEHTYRMKSSGFLGSEEDVEAERRKIDFPVVLAALDGLTASQVRKVEEVFYQFDKASTLRDCLFGLGESGRKADLTPDQVARLKVLMQGTKPEPIPPDVMEELRRYPPDIAGRYRAALEKQADAGPALLRFEADAIELHELLADELNEARRERVMTMHRRKREEIDAVDAAYDKNYGPGVLATELNKRLDGLQRTRMTMLREGKVAQADACAIEDKRRKIEELNEQDASVSSMGMFGGGTYYDVLKQQRDKQRQGLTADIRAIVELNKQEALKDPANAGKGAGQAVAERISELMGTQPGGAGTTLGEALGGTLAKEDAGVLTSMADTWNAVGSANLVQSAAAQLAADERAGTTSAKRIMETLRSFRETAKRDLTARAYDPATPIEEKQAFLREGESAVTRLAQRYVEEYKTAYDRINGGRGRSYDEIVRSADEADEQLIQDLSYGGGRTSDLGELQHAMAKRDVDAVKAILRRQPHRDALAQLTAGYNGLGSGRDLRRELFGVTMEGRTATPEQAQTDEAFAAVGGLVRGRDAALIAEQLGKPTAAEMGGEGRGAAEAKWFAEGGAAEYGATMENRGVTGRLREIGDDPETQRLLERTNRDLAALKAQFDVETDPAKRGRLVLEMRRLRATLTGDAEAYEKDNERVLGEIRSALSFAVSIALAVAIPGAGAGVVAFLQTTAINIAANVAANFVIKGGDYGLDDLKADVLGGVLGAGGAKFGEELLGRVAAAVVRPAAEATAETASKLGVKTVLSSEVGTLAGAGERAAIRAEEFEIRAATREAAEAIVTKEVAETGGSAVAAALPGAAARRIAVTSAREFGGFFGGIFGPKVLTGDFDLTLEEVLKAFAATAAGKVAHRNPAGKSTEEPTTGKATEEPTTGKATEEPATGKATEEPATGKAPEEPARKGAEEDAPALRPEEDGGGPAAAVEGGLPVGAGLVPEAVPANADVFGPRSPREMLLDNGIPPASADGFQQIADDHNVVIKVRPTNTASLPVLEAGGVAKPELIKAKTVNRVDLLIGAPADGVGKVGFFEPTMPSEAILGVMAPDARQAVEQRFAQRNEEYTHYKEEYGKLAAEGLLRIKDGVLQIADPTTAATPEAPRGQFKDIGGDHDLFAITNADGTPLPAAVRRAIVAKLRSMGINVEHADHVSWPVDSPGSYDPGADAKIRAQHETSEPLVAFVPKAQPREVMAGDAVTGPARTEGPGDRFLPASRGQVVEPDGGGPTGRTDETDFSVPARKATPEEIAAAREHLAQERATLEESARERAAAREPSPMMGRARRTGDKADVSAEAYRMAERLQSVREDWPGLSPKERAERLVTAIHDELVATGVPEPLVTPVAGDNSHFRLDSWLIGLGHPALALDHPTITDFALACDHARHEMAHAVMEFRRIRQEVQGSLEPSADLARRLNVERQVVEWARQMETFPPGTFETIQGAVADQVTELNKSLRDPGRDKILGRMRAADEALTKAEQADAAARSPATESALAGARKAYDAAFVEYAALPDEVLAWRAGRQLQNAVEGYARLRPRLVKAYENLEAARAAVEDAMEHDLSGKELADVQKRLTDAEQTWHDLVEDLDRRTGRRQ